MCYRNCPHEYRDGTCSLPAPTEQDCEGTADPDEISIDDAWFEDMDVVARMAGLNYRRIGGEI